MVYARSCIPNNNGYYVPLHNLGEEHILLHASTFPKKALILSTTT